MKISLNVDDNQFWQLISACDMAKEKYGENCEHMQTIADAIGKGKRFPLFAEGEAGVTAARRLAEEFARQQDKIDELKEMFLQAYEEGDEE